MDTAVFVVTERQGAVVFHVRVVPNAKRNEIIGAFQGALKVKVAAPPVEGAANEALVKFLAGTLGIRASQVEILRGGSARIKMLRVTGLSADEVQRRLASSADVAR